MIKIFLLFTCQIFLAKAEIVENDTSRIMGFAGVYDESTTIYLNDVNTVESEEGMAQDLSNLNNPFEIDDSSIDIGEGSASIASWYGPGFNGRKTCNGEVYDQTQMTLAAHKWIGQKVCVRNTRNPSIFSNARITDCGPYEIKKIDTGKRNKHGKRIYKKIFVPHHIRSYDLSKGLMRKMKGEAEGLVEVTITLGRCQ